MAMSPRNFARVFTRELATTPRAMSSARAWRRRASGSRTRARASTRSRALCGFGSAETLRRAFQRLLGVSPSAYRETFARAIDQEKEKRA
jgi:AraC-like DNA-binding protein